MQIITGKFRGRKLVAPKGEQTRPTLARVKESLFCLIADKVSGSKVLDLFAGSGAFAAECFSRDAAEITLVEPNNLAIDAITKNLRGMQYTLLKLGYDHALHRLKNLNKKFDIIFLDPPYDSDFDIVSLRLIAKFALLEEGGIVILETRAQNRLQNLPKSYIIQKERQYGISRIFILELKNE